MPLRTETSEPIQVLLVEDDPDDVFFFRRALPERCKLAIAKDGEEGLKKIREMLPDVVFLDLKLPRFSGEEVCKAVREDRDKRLSRIPIVVISSKSGDVDRVVCKVIGVNGHISKPYRSEDILMQLRLLFPSFKQEEFQKRFRVLVVEDDKDDVVLVKVMLSKDPKNTYDFAVVDRLERGIRAIRKWKPDLIIADLGLPDSYGMNTLSQLVDVACGAPVLVLSGQDDDRLAEAMIRKGAQEYLKKRELNPASFIRAVQYAIGRNQLVQKAGRETVTDPATGLFNRSAFLVMTEHLMKLAKQNAQGCFLIHADVDALKVVNDVYGHAKGDEALLQVAVILRETFRDTDVVARVGGDEFAVVVYGLDEEHIRPMLDRLNETLRDFNQKRGEGRPAFTLGLRLGVVDLGQEKPNALEAVLEKAHDAGKCDRT